MKSLAATLSLGVALSHPSPHLTHVPSHPIRSPHQAGNIVGAMSAKLMRMISGYYAMYFTLAGRSESYVAPPVQVTSATVGCPPSTRTFTHPTGLLKPGPEPEPAGIDDVERAFAVDKAAAPAVRDGGRP